MIRISTIGLRRSAAGNPRRILVALFLLGGLAAGCAPPAVKTTALVPARFHEATRLREVSVLPFDGPEGRDFAAELEATLAGASVDDRPYYTLIDRTRLTQVLKEQEMGQTGLIDEATAAKVGRMLGAKGIYSGVVTARGVKDNRYSEQRQECTQREIKKDSKGNSYEGSCTQWRKFSVSCTKRDAVFSFTPKLIEVETGRIVYSQNVAGTASASGCQDSGKPLAGEIELLDKAKSTAKEIFKKDVAPTYVAVEIRTMDAREGIAGKEAGEKFSSGLEFAGKNRLDRACELWGEARGLAPNAPSILYNLGICAEVRGDLGSALDLYKKADRQLNKPNEKITAAMGRVNDAIKKRQVLAEQMKK